MISLKTFLPILAPMIGTTPSVLYERQRALVRLGLLSAIAGRGPGSGVPLNARTVATLLIAYSAADTLSDVEKRVPAICSAAADGDMIPDKQQRCLLTGQETFADALTFILLDPDLASSVASLQIQLNGPEVEIWFWEPDDGDDPRGRTSFTFGPEAGVMGSALKGVMKTASIRRELLIGLADTLQGIGLTAGTSYEGVMPTRDRETER